MDIVANYDSPFSSINYMYAKIIDLVKVGELFNIEMKDGNHMCVKDIRG